MSVTAASVFRGPPKSGEAVLREKGPGGRMYKFDPRRDMEEYLGCFVPKLDSAGRSGMRDMVARLCSLVALGLLLGSCDKGRPAVLLVEGGPTRSADVSAASIVALIADPARYHNRHVAVVGVARLDFEGTALYLHREDYDRRIATNGLWLQMNSTNLPQLRQEMEGAYVAVQGRLDSENRGFRGLYSGSIEVDRIERLPEPMRRGHTGP